MPDDRSVPDGQGPAAGSPQSAHGEEILYRIFEFAPDAILLVDRTGVIVRANTQAEQMFGYHRDELIGQPVEILIPERFAARHIGHRSDYIAAPRTRPMGAGLELLGRRRDASEFPVDIMLSPLDAGPDSLMLGVVRDATERKRTEALAEEAREMYFKEVHHRVKNNLQVISSLLFLQSAETSDPHTLAILTESQSRVKSIALIHEKLYRSTELTTVHFGEYVRELVADLIHTYGVNPQALEVRTDVEDTALEIDTAVPCGLIINELVSNALKHAFPGGAAGALSVSMRAAGPRHHQLTVQDTGVGLPAGLDWRTSPSLGLRLVSDLTRQLDGDLTIESGAGGTTVAIRFAELQYKERHV